MPRAYLPTSAFSSFGHQVGRPFYFGSKRTVEGKQYPIYCRKARAENDPICLNLTAPEEVVLDQNVLAEGFKYSRLGAYSPSPNGKYVAYLHDTEGDEFYSIHVRDIASGTELPGLEAIQDAYDTIAWGKTTNVLYYVTQDDANRPYRVYRFQYFILSLFTLFPCPFVLLL